MADPSTSGSAPPGWRSCPKCGAVGPPEHSFCYRCGTRIPAAVEPVHPCASCGTLVDERTQTFCGKCGRPLGSSSLGPAPHVGAAEPAPLPEGSRPGPSGSRLLPWILVLVLTIALVSVGGLWGIGYAPWRSSTGASTPAPTGPAQIVGMRWSITYTNSSSPAFGPSQASDCQNCPVVLAADGHGSTTWVFSNALNRAVSVRSVTIGGPFAQTSINPTLPATVGPGGGLGVVVGYRATVASGDLVLYLNATVR